MTRTPLDEHMDTRRIELRMQWQEVARAAGLSLAGLGAIRRGERNPSALTRRALEHALSWVPGSVTRILDGGEPEPVAQPASMTVEEAEAYIRAGKYLSDDEKDALVAFLHILRRQSRSGNDQAI